MRADLAVVSYWSLLYIEDKDDEIFLMPSSPSLSRHIVVKVRVGSEKDAGQGLPKYVDFEKKKSVEAHTNDQTRISIHKRLLRVKTNDYGSYDPAPTFHKPKFKQIPN
uniref:Uncharacterized protein n=1 Tax=Daucus carota subsp. sativus TaxID=79200 RepID=A0A166JG30_DAUCS